VNIVGDQATYHRPLDPPLTADTEGWARGVSGWVRTATDVRTVGSDAAAAVQAAMMAPGQIATLILPSDTSWNEGGVVAEALPRQAASRVSPSQIEAAANALRRGGAGVVLLLGGTALHEKGLALAHRIATATGCRVVAQGSNARMARGQGRLPVERVPYVVDVAVKAMAGTKQLILAGSRKPVTFFAYPNMVQSSVPDDAEVHVLARPEQDISDALAQLADALNCPMIAAPNNGVRPDPGKGALTPEAVASLPRPGQLRRTTG
jgi:acetolactate synthase-1/2/3 large subunit